MLSGMREDLKRAIEQGQNFSAKYKDSISISLLVRQESKLNAYIKSILLSNYINTSAALDYTENTMPATNRINPAARQDGAAKSGKRLYASPKESCSLLTPSAASL